MNQKLFCLALVILIPSSLHSFTDSLWIVGREGVPGGLVPIQVWLQYQGSGPGDSISAFDIPLTWDATVCTVQAITIGSDFREHRFPWTCLWRIDNHGTDGTPAIPKVAVFAYSSNMPLTGLEVERGSHLAATVDFRILHTATPGDSAYIDTLMRAFSPPEFLGFVDKGGITTYIPSFSTDCIIVIPCTCGDCNGDGRLTVADAIYTFTYIYKGGSEPACEGDVNQDQRITIADAIYLGNYIYRGGPEPCNPPLTAPLKEKRMER